ncbi:MAG: PH domain-containing protein [Brachybacterium sp.]|uniref:PH domain-containing protein n=1 Tax=Brachybacterium sp. TaxID=1891286 RepID=UPI0026532E0A|nr:PH domain-containing protein [Brachybacterium sp.]MDN6304016.1 PH domain-containing protein [Brachybacterium sp.]MDN6328865.1 PH domain-containing protein [Brachybacterium sp.]
MSTPGQDTAGGEQRATIVLRPRAVRVAAYVSAVVVMAGMIAGAVMITSFQWGGRIGLLVVGVLVFLFCHLEASVKVTARPEELEVRNLMRTRTLEWPEVLGISFPMGDPWAHLDLADGRTHPLNAIQRYDGERAIAAAHQLQALIRERGEAPPA